MKNRTLIYKYIFILLVALLFGNLLVFLGIKSDPITCANFILLGIFLKDNLKGEKNNGRKY